jgi:hypothetical protein
LLQFTFSSAAHCSYALRVVHHVCLQEPNTKQNITCSVSGFQLPEELLPNLLCFLDIQQRMRSAALVWHAAANAATTCVSVTIAESDIRVEDPPSGAPQLYRWGAKHDALAAWLSRDHNAQNVTSICVEAADSVLQAEVDSEFVPSLVLQPMQLPHLRSLNLSGCCLHIKLATAAAAAAHLPAPRGRRRKSCSKASSSAGPAAALDPLAGMLTALELRNVRFVTFPADEHAHEGVLSHLAVLTSLQRLRIREAFTVGRHTPEGVGVALCNLPQLTHLLLDNLEDSDEAFEMAAAAGALQQLKELELRYGGPYATCKRHLGTHLPCSITSLKVRLCCEGDLCVVKGVARCVNSSDAKASLKVRLCCAGWQEEWPDMQVMALQKHGWCTF